MSEASASLLAFLRAYAAGDRTARLALGDWLEERGDARAEAVRAAEVDWDAVAWTLFVERYPYWVREREPVRPRQRLPAFQQAELNRIRWWIECALAGADPPADVTYAVRQAHRAWLTRLFPEMAAALSDP